MKEEYQIMTSGLNGYVVLAVDTLSRRHGR